MELQLFSFPALFSFLLFLLILRKIHSKRSSPKLPPGPWKLPIIGNLHQLGGGLPHRTLWNLSKKYGPMMHLKMGEVSTIVFSSPEAARDVLKTHDTIFASRPPLLVTSIMTYGCTNITSSPYGEYWRQLRRICILELLSTKRVLSYRAIREEEMNKIVDWISSNKGKPVNLTEKIYESQYAMTSRAAFGNKSKEQENFIEVVKEAIPFAAGFGIADLFPSIKILQVMSNAKPKIEKLHHESDRILEDIIKEHRRKKSEKKKTGEGGDEYEDLVDVMLRCQDEGEFKLTTDNIKAVIFVSFLFFVFFSSLNFQLPFACQKN